jgi:hypothetical protein
MISDAKLPKTDMCISNGSDIVEKIAFNVDELVMKENCSVAVAATPKLLPMNSSELDNSSGSSTSPCSDELSTDDDESAHQRQRRRPSLVLPKVRHTIEAGFGFEQGSKNNMCTEPDSSHRSAKFDLSPEGLDNENEESPPFLAQDLVESDKSMDSSSRHEVSPQKPIFDRIKSTPALTEAPKLPLPRIKSTPARMQSQLRSCLKDSRSCTTNNSTRSVNSNDFSVHFGTITIREYERALADNPSVTDGPPIGLGWEYDPKEIFLSVDAYEEHKPTPRIKQEFLIPARVREEMLLHEWGHTLRDVRRATQESKEIRKRRERAQRTSKASERVCEFLEVSKRKWRRLKTRSSKQMEEEELWEQCTATSNDHDEPCS